MSDNLDIIRGNALETEKLAQIETVCGNPPLKMAQFEPKSLALTDRNHWHKSNRISQAINKPLNSFVQSKNGYEK